MTNDQRKTILRWFWRVCFSKRYNSQPLKTVQADIEAMLKLKVGNLKELGKFSINQINAESYRSELFRVNNVSTKTFILMLAQSQPLSFVSGLQISLDKVLKDYNRNEFHHLYPRSYLRNLSDVKYDVNSLANFCFLTRTDNNILGGVAPSIYKQKMPNDSDLILERSLCPKSLFDDDYNRFVEERSIWLTNIANQLIF